MRTFTINCTTHGIFGFGQDRMVADVNHRARAAQLLHSHAWRPVKQLRALKHRARLLVTGAGLLPAIYRLAMSEPQLCRQTVLSRCPRTST